MDEKLSAEQNWKALREQQHFTNVATIPYLGVYLTDLVYMEEAPSVSESKTSSAPLVNFDKFRRVASIVQVRLFGSFRMRSLR